MIEDTKDRPPATGERDPAAGGGGKRVNLPTWDDVWVGPLGHLAEERERLGAMEWAHFSVTPLAATVGAELDGIDLTAELSDDAIAEVRAALHAYKVIFFRDQPLTPEQHTAFAKRFGELEIHPFIPSNTGVPELVRFSKNAEIGGYENGWHHDVTWREVPSMGAILHAIDVPATGGDTLFADMYAAYDGLSPEVKERIDGLTAEHDFMRTFGGSLDDEQKAEMRKKYPLAHHPVVIRHHATGKKLLYVNRFFTNRIVELDDAESHELLGHLCDQAHTLEYQCRFRWEKDSVAFWDNRAVQHYASSDYWPDVRVMERASIIGIRPAA